MIVYFIMEGKENNLKSRCESILLFKFFPFQNQNSQIYLKELMSIDLFWMTGPQHLTARSPVEVALHFWI